MKSWHGKVALVTNSASDLGVSAVEELSKKGVITIGFVKDKDTMKAVLKIIKKNNKQAKIFLYQCDISNVQQLEVAVKKIVKDYGGIDILVNNKEEGGSLGTDKDVIDMNIFGTVACVRLVAGTMIERKGKGHIIFVNNTLKTEDEKLRNLYEATNTAVSSINELLRQEFRYLKANVKSTIIDCRKVTKEDDNVGAELKNDDIIKAMITVLDTEEHLHIHEMAIE